MIRPAKIEDLPYVLELIQELADFEKEPQEVEITLNTLEEDGFGAHAKFHCFVADVDEKIVGMALVYPRYSTWKGTVLHLEDLIVKASKRGRGIGSQLLDAVVRYGKELQVKRISWEVLEWNTPAIDFYESKGANVMRDWNVVQMNEQGIANYFKN